MELWALHQIARAPRAQHAHLQTKSLNDMHTSAGNCMLWIDRLLGTSCIFLTFACSIPRTQRLFLDDEHEVSPLPPASAETPAVMHSHDSSRRACILSVEGIPSPSARRPTSTPAFNQMLMLINTDWRRISF